MNDEQRRKINRALWAAWFDSLWRLKWAIAGGVILFAILAIYAADQPETSVIERLTLSAEREVQNNGSVMLVWELTTSDDQIVRAKAPDAFSFVEGAEYCAEVSETLVQDRLKITPGTLKPCDVTD